MKNMYYILFGLFLFTAACEDLKEKKVSVWIFAGAGLCGILLHFMEGSFGWQQLLGCLVGAVVLLISFLTSGQIGSGDGWFFIVSGLYLNGLLNLKLLVYGVFLNGIVCTGIYFISLKKGGNAGKKTIPFLPLLIPVWLCMVIV